MTEIKHKKNTAKELMIAMVDSSSPASLKSGLTVADTAYYKDGAGAWTSLSITDTVTEIASTGMYTLELIAAELNHDMVMVKLTATGAADTVYILDMTTNDIDDIATDIAALNDISTSDVNAQVVGVIRTDTVAEPAQGAPPATTTLQKKIDYLYTVLRNKQKSNATTITIYADDGTTELMRTTVSDVSSEYNKAKYVTGT